MFTDLEGPQYSYTYHGKSILGHVDKYIFNVQMMVNGDYILSITLRSYSNQDNRCAGCRSENIDSYGCCDNWESTSCTGSRMCETYFQYCLLPLETISTAREPVHCRVIAQSTSTENGGTIDFSQSLVLGLSNPLQLSGISNAWMVSATFKNRDRNSSHSKCVALVQQVVIMMIRPNWNAMNCIWQFLRHLTN